VINNIVTQSWETIPNCTSGKIEPTLPAYSHTIVLLVSSLNLVYLLKVDCSRGEFVHGDVKGSNGGFRHWPVSGLAISSVAACFSNPNVHSVYFAFISAIKEPAHLFQAGFWASLVPYHRTVTFSRHSSPTNHPM